MPSLQGIFCCYHRSPSCLVGQQQQGWLQEPCLCTECRQCLEMWSCCSQAGCPPLASSDQWVCQGFWSQSPAGRCRSRRGREGSCWGALQGYIQLPRDRHPRCSPLIHKEAPELDTSALPPTSSVLSHWSRSKGPPGGCIAFPHPCCRHDLGQNQLFSADLRHWSEDWLVLDPWVE